MGNDIFEVTDETKKILSSSNEPKFDEQEAYFLLCEIFAHAQATKDYAKFQTDLNEWKKRFPIEDFQDISYKTKIKYMLSKEFLDTVLKNFIAFDELSKKDPSQGLEKLRKILNKAEKHKDAKQLDRDLEDLYKEYPLSYLKEKYPHKVPQMLSKSNRTRILEKFDSSLAFKELDNIVQHPDSFESVDDFKNTIEEWQKLYPTADFNDKYRPQVEKLLTETLDSRKLEELFPVSAELDLSLGEVIPLELKDSVKNISLLSKDALHDFFKIVDKNKGDVDSLFKWICKYNRYINSFDPTIKTAIVENLMTKYAYELPPVNTKYQIPKMDSGMDDLLSLSDYKNMDDTKKQVLLQVLGILSTGKELTHEDIYRIAVIDSNVKKVEEIEKAKIEPKLDLFMEKFPEDKLTPSFYLEPISDTRIDVSVENDIDLTLHNDENDNLVVEDEKVHTSEPASFKEAIKVEETLEKVNVSGNNGTSDSTGTSGGGSVSISSTEIEVAKNDAEVSDEDKKNNEDENITAEQNFINNTQQIHFNEEKTLKAVVLESEPEDVETELQPEIKNTTTKSTDIENTTENTSPVEETSHKSPVQNFFNRLLGRERHETEKDDGRDDR